MKYQLSSLGWYNFEVLTQGLLKDVIGPGVTSYGGSRDGGRDATFKGISKSFPTPGDPWTGQWVFQAKFVDTSVVGQEQARKGLVSTLRKEMMQAPALKRGWANNYILLTNVELTGTTRDKMDQMASSSFPNIRFHVVDGKDIENLLDSRPGLRRSFPQLLGLGDLEHIINRDLYTRSQLFVQTWQRRLSTFAVTRPYLTASSVLNEEHFVVLDGPPESGKSMIAAALSLSHAVAGFEVIELRESRDFYSSLDLGVRQLFVADDVIGSNEFDPELGEDWARGLEGIVASLDASHKLVWTSRRYILQAALERTRLGESIDHFPSPHEVLVEVDAYSRFERANILYNHAKASPVSDRGRHILRQTGLSIIANPNFTPERVRQLVESFLPELEGADDPQAEITALFEDPTPRWAKAYLALSQSEQALLLALVDQGRTATIDSLQMQYGTQVSLQTAALSFQQCIERLKHSFIRVTPHYDGTQRVDFQHPSLRDMLLKALVDTPAVKRQFIESASIKGIRAILNDLVAGANGSGTTFVTETDFASLSARIKDFQGAPISQSDWHALLTTAKALVAVPERDALHGFRYDLLVTILGAACSPQLYEANTAWGSDDWIRFVGSLYPLLPLSPNLDRPQYIHQVTKHIVDKADFDAGLKLACLLQEYETVMFRRPAFSSKVEQWIEELHGALEQACDDAPSEPATEDEYDDWKEVADELLDLVGELDAAQLVDDKTILELAESLDGLASTIEVLGDDADDDDYYEPVRVKEEGWTAEGLIADI